MIPGSSVSARRARFEKCPTGTSRPSRPRVHAGSPRRPAPNATRAAGMSASSRRGRQRARSVSAGVSSYPRSSATLRSRCAARPAAPSTTSARAAAQDALVRPYRCIAVVGGYPSRGGVRGTPPCGSGATGVHDAPPARVAGHGPAQSVPVPTLPAPPEAPPGTQWKRFFQAYAVDRGMPSRRRYAQRGP